MATYYVRTDGNNGNTGTGIATNQAWQTITYALANMVLTNGTNYLYIAPGIYRESPTVTVTPSSTQTLVIQGDPTGAIFTGVTPNIIFVTNFSNDNVEPSFANVFTCAKTYVTLKNLQICGYGYTQFSSASNITLENCVFATSRNTSSGFRGTVRLATASNNPLNSIITKCSFYGDVGLFIQGQTTGSAYDFNTTVSDCVFMGGSGLQVDGPTFNTITVGNGVLIYNNTFVYADSGVSVRSSNASNLSYAYNNVFYGIGSSSTGALGSNTTGRLIEDYNRIASVTARTSVDTGVNSRTGLTGLDLNATQITAGIPTAFFSPYLSSPLIGAGTSSGAPVTDQYGFAWTSATDIGAFSRTSLTSTSFYYPTERNASAITIAPTSTSQSIELYLGATGLTFSTSGLAAYYVRNQSAPVAITLVTQTPTGTWASGGFAEISSSLVPGVYRLDVPNAAFAAGASDVTIVVRGASGTNGAVLTVTLSSGGLTAAQTAAAVFDAVASSYTTAGSMGARLLKTTVDNRPVDVGTSFHIQSNIHAIVDSTAAADEFKGALLHNGTDYISADLLTPVSAATSVHIGPYQLLADGLGASDPLDVNVGTATSIDVQVTDANGTGIDITGATVSAKVYSSAGTLVATYAGTATYADNGRLSFGLTTTVTNTSGTYTITVTRTTGATDTQIFGPLRLYVRPA
jgi:hypothetical protein